MTMRLNFIHECIQNRTISLKYINTNLEVADVLTKLLPVSAHELHTQRLMKGHYGELPKSTDLNRRTMDKTEDPILVNVYLSIPTVGLMSLKKKCKPRE